VILLKNNNTGKKIFAFSKSKKLKKEVNKIITQKKEKKKIQKIIIKRIERKETKHNNKKHFFVPSVLRNLRELIQA